MLKVGRRTQEFGAKVLLQPFAYGVTDRPAGLAIDVLAVVADSAIHGVFRFVIISSWSAASIHGGGNGCGK
jgi:hypothetical protein